MFMPGITDNWVGKLVQGMNRAAASMLETPPAVSTRNDPTDLSPPRSEFLETEFVDEHGRIFTYPTCLSRNSGLDMSLCLFGNFARFSEPLLITEDTVEMVNRGEKQYVSTDFITPYPPGYPIAVPGQVLRAELLDYLLHTEHGEVHGMEISPRMHRTIDAIDIEKLRRLDFARP